MTTYCRIFDDTKLQYCLYCNTSHDIAYIIMHSIIKTYLYLKLTYTIYNKKKHT